jgi:hypothetical protein
MSMLSDFNIYQQHRFNNTAFEIYYKTKNLRLGLYIHPDKNQVSVSTLSQPTADGPVILLESSTHVHYLAMAFPFPEYFRERGPAQPIPGIPNMHQWDTAPNLMPNNMPWNRIPEFPPRFFPPQPPYPPMPFQREEPPFGYSEAYGHPSNDPRRFNPIPEFPVYNFVYF